MYVAKIMENDVVNCINGITVSLFMSGCPHHCKGCFNQETWNRKFGTKMSLFKLKRLIYKKIIDFGVERSFSILGGEPLAPYNIKNTNKIIKYIRHKLPNITIYLWSGYTKDELETMKTYDIFKNIDYLIEGRFIEKRKKSDLKLRGSSNQRIFKNENNLLNDVTKKFK